MNIDPALDKWVWILLVALLVLLGVRAWVVETGRRQFGGTPSRVRALTVASGVVLVALTTLFMTQAGALLVQSVVTRGDPLSQLGGADDNGPDPNGAQAPAGQQPAGGAGAAPAAPGAAGG
jgi:hypothetical protein